MNKIVDFLEASEDSRPEHAYDSLDPGAEQEDMDDTEQLEPPDKSQLPSEEKEAHGPENSRIKPIEVDSDKIMYDFARKLSFEQMIPFVKLINFCKRVVLSQKRHCPIVAPRMIVHGGGGVGKSFMINTIAKWCEKILRQPGDNPDMPVCLKLAFTGCAAVNISGFTMSSALSMGFACKLEAMQDKNRDTKRAQYRDLKVVIIDEISMVGKSMNELLSFRLGEITNKRHLPYGGLAVFFFGDLCQLRPVKSSFIFTEGTSREDETGASALAPLWNMFSTLTLEVNHRQGEDKPYAEMLNRIRRDKQTADDLLPLMERVRELGHPDLEQADVWIAGKKLPCERRNNECIERLPGEAIVIPASHANPVQTNYRPPINAKDGTVHDTGYPDKLRVKLGARVMIIDNVNVADGLCNGQLGTLVALVYTKTGRVDKLVIKLKDSKAGEANRSKFRQLAQQYPECVFIERANRTYQLSKRSGDVGSSASVIQFPVRVAHCMTCHKCQGKSIIKPTKVATNRFC